MARQRTSRDAATITIAIDTEVNNILRSLARGNRTKQQIAEELLLDQIDLLPHVPWSDPRVTMTETNSVVLSASIDTDLETIRTAWRAHGQPISKGALASLLIRRGLDTLPAPGPSDAIRRITMDLDPDVDNALHASLAQRRATGESAISLRQIIHEALRKGLGLL